MISKLLTLGLLSVTLTGCPLTSSTPSIEICPQGFEYIVPTEADMEVTSPELDKQILTYNCLFIHKCLGEEIPSQCLTD